jgi:hypothetical protein
MGCAMFQVPSSCSTHQFCAQLKIGKECMPQLKLKELTPQQYRDRRAQRVRGMSYRQLADELEVARLYLEDGARRTADLIVEVVAEELRRRAK